MIDESLQRVTQPERVADPCRQRLKLDPFALSGTLPLNVKMKTSTFMYFGRAKMLVTHGMNEQAI